MSQKSIGEVKNILQDAAEDGVISQKALQVIDINDTVLAGIDGTDIDDIQATDVTLLTLVVDDTGSLAHLIDSVIEGQNQLLEAIRNSKQKDNILLALWKFDADSKLVHSYVPVGQATKLDRRNYRASGSSTALNDAWMNAMASNIAYAQMLRSSGTPVKNIAVVITDGQDNDSRRYRAADCAKVNKDLLKSEQFILAFVGMGQTAADETQFRLIAEEMGFPDGAILTVDSTPSEIRKIFNMISQSAIRASQKAVSAAAQNSFFNP
ncbi:MAG: hypothetical protein A3J63_01985 [Candidatus Moranbacteria bacterium RIFCSPHIGHO2_02_FULL_40_12b]|nr:MAG: hypothetical protein A3J63_01985 [Candidatus Moranbacteria bacterium RIFCSPHIGHO2_02_FULL_40_12b]